MGMYPGGNIIRITPSDLTASAISNNDVVFAKNELKNAVGTRGGCSLLRTFTMFIEGAEAADDLILLFFDNSTDLGAATDAATSTISADEFRAAGCIGAMKFDGGYAMDMGNGLLYTGDIIDSNFSQAPIIVQAADGGTSVWVACIQYGGTLHLTDTDSLTCTFGFQFLG